MSKTKEKCPRLTLFKKPVCVLDEVYMLVRKRDGALLYSRPATTAKECWENYAKTRFGTNGNVVGEVVCPVFYGDYILGTGMDVAQLKKDGWRALRVQIVDRP